MKEFLRVANDVLSIGSLSKAKTERTRLLLVDDYAPLRNALRELLERQEDMHVAGEAENPQDAMKKGWTLAFLPGVRWRQRVQYGASYHEPRSYG